MLRSLCLALTTGLLALAGIHNLSAAEAASGNVDQLKFGGEVSEEEASFTLTGHFKGGGEDADAIYSSRAIASGVAGMDAFTQTIQFEANLVRGKLKELIIAMRGEGNVIQLQGEGVLDWSVRRDREGNRYLVVRVDETKKDLKQLKFQIETKLEIERLPLRVTPVIFVPVNPALHEGLLRYVTTLDTSLEVLEATDLTRIEAEQTDSLFPKVAGQSDAEPVAFRFFATQPKLVLEVSAADPDARRVTFEQFALSGRISGDQANFTLKGVARLKNPKGGELLVLGGAAALIQLDSGKPYRIEHREAVYYLVRPGDTATAIGRKHGAELSELAAGNPGVNLDRIRVGQQLIIPRPGWMPGYYLVFDGPGEFPIELKFDARVSERAGWRSLNFEVAPSSLRPVSVAGLPADTEFRFTTTSTPERSGDAFNANLPATGRFAMEWKEARPEGEGRLFYSVESLAEISVSPGLMRQTHLFDLRIMQGEMNRVTLALAGEGEVIRVAGPDILSWNVEGTGDDRQLVIQLNQAKKSDFALAVHTQTPLGAFPLGMKPVRFRPENATRFGGYLRVVNDGAVRLEVTTATGLSQVSPTQFPPTQALRVINEQSGVQVFAYRFSDGAYELAVQADNILPELSVSELLVYHVGETESVITGELELEIREAPLREFTMLVPPGYVVAQINNAHLGDYFLTRDDAGGPSRLRLVFSAPVTGRELINLRLEDNRTLETANWELPRIQPQQVKSVRGYLGVAADPGLRLTTVSANESLTEVAPAFFPRREEGLQLSWRLRDGDWSATVGIERLQLSVQVDALHLFSIGEGIAYGSSVLNYFVSGSPVSALQFTAPTNYANVEFVGRDVRGWRQTSPGNYEVSLNSSVFGAYTLLATYDRQFPRQQATLAFDGVQPTGVQSEQGHVIVVSDFQFQVEPTTVSSGLINLEPAEIPAEHRLLFASPVLASYQYVSRPFNLELKLTALDQGETMALVVDRASIQSRVSSEGHVLTDLKYLIKSKGNSHLRLTLPAEVELWNSMVDGAKVVPVADGSDTLIPLPQKSDPNEIITLDLKLAGRSKDAEDVELKLPVIASPVLQTDWRVEPEQNHRLAYREGSLKPTNITVEYTGFDWLRGLFRGAGEGLSSLLISLGLALVGLAFMRWATGDNRHRGDAKNLFGVILGVGCFGLSLVILLGATVGSRVVTASADPALSFSTPILDAGSAVAISVSNLESGAAPSFIWKLWPLVLALAAWIYQFRFSPGVLRAFFAWVGWVLVFWATLRAPVGGMLFGPALAGFVFLHLMLPAWAAQRRLPRSSDSDSGTSSMTGATALLLAGLFLMPAMAKAASNPVKPLVVTAIEQSARVEDEALVVNARLKWTAEAGQWLDFLRQPAVLVRVDYPTANLKLIQSQSDGRPVYRLTASAAGQFEIQFEYQLPLAKGQTERTIDLPTPHGLVNRLTLEVTGQDVEVSSPQAVSLKRQLIQRDGKETTRAELVLAPQTQSQVSWRPRSRDTSTEAAVFYAEFAHLLIPGTGVIEGVHEAYVRLAQGQLGELEFLVPGQFTITDVQADIVSTWRFDPDARKLRVQFKSPLAGSFSLRITSQVAARPLPYEQTLELLTVTGAANQIGTLGIATGGDTQVEDATVENLAPINLEDFPRSPLAYAQSRDGSVNLRRAYRFSDSGAKVTLAAAAVEPDIRVTSQETLSLAEDRTVLAINLTANITRAGIFKLSFALPDRLEVETLASPALSHWTELRDGGERIVTMHLRGKTEGQQTFALTLTGPGLTGEPQLVIPRVTLREASKQTGQLVVTPELGIRLHVNEREGVTQLDPKQINIRQAGVLAFRLLQSAWRLNLDVEKVEPSLQVNMLQDVTVKDGQLQVIANLDYVVENAGINSLQLQLPAGAESVVFKGEHITDSIKADPGTNPLATWTVKLSRRVVGNYRLKVTFKVIAGDGAAANLAGVIADGVTLQRGHLAVRSGGRLEVQLPTVPASLAKADWQSVTPGLRDGVKSEEPNHLFRVVEPAFSLALNIVRHEAAKLLPARVENVNLVSTVSPAGEVLTEVRLMLHPGDKRLLRLGLPAGSEFWFAFVNGESKLPWQEGDKLLIPLEKNSDPSQPALVEFFYASQAPGRVKGFDYRLPGPEFDLPLQNITWTMHIDERWAVTKWDDRWQMQTQAVTSAPGRGGLESYLSRATEVRKAKTVQAESLLQKGNLLVEQGDQQNARKAFQAALELSQHDAALNEDARVQLQTLKQQQAVVGLNVFNRANAERQQAAAPAFQQQMEQVPFQLGVQANYTQQQAKQLMDQTSSEDNAAFMKLADRLVRQQDAAVSRADAIRATLPVQGRSVTFTRALQVDSGTGAGLELGLDLDRSVSTGAPRFWPMLLVALGLGLLWLIGGRLVRRPPAAQ